MLVPRFSGEKSECFCRFRGGAIQRFDGSDLILCRLLIDALEPVSKEATDLRQCQVFLCGHDRLNKSAACDPGN